MAFKKTGGRSALVQPTGLPNFSGFKQAAASYNQIGELAYGIGLDDRKRQFNQLIRQAEIDGKTAGVSYDEQGNLVPLTNFDYAKASETYAEADQKQILSTYRKAAVQTYVNAAANDINSAAAQALIDNPNDPAAIRSSAQGYLQGIQNLDDEIYTALAPKVASAFTRVENQALAQQRSDEIEYAVDQGTKAYNQNAIELGVLYAKSEGTNNPAQAQALQDRIDEILGEQADILMGLEANEVSSTVIDQMQDAQATVIAARTSQAAVERSYSLNGAAQTYTMINEMFREAQLNPDVDANAMRDAMVASVNMMSQIDAAQSQEEKEARASIYGGYRLSIVQNGTNIQTELMNPESAIHQLDPSQIANLLLEGESRLAYTRNANDAKLERRWKNNKTTYENNLKILQNPQVSDLFTINDAFKDIQMLASWGQLGPEGPGLLVEAKAAHRAAMQTFMKKGRDQTGSAIQLELGPLSSYSEPPAFYTEPTYVESLERSGVIGKDGYWTNRKAYLNDVEGYADKYAQRSNKVRLARSGDLKLRNGQASSVTTAELNAMGEVMGFGKVSTDQGFVDINLLSDDEAVFAASSNAIAGFAVETGGLLHPTAKGFFQASMHSVENAERARRVMAQVVSAIRSDRNIDEDHVEGIFYNNLDENVVGFLRTVNKFGPELAVEMFSPKNKMSQNRTAAVLAAHPKYADMSEAEAFDAMFEDAFKEGLEGRSFFKFMDPYITDDDDMMLGEMAHIGGVSNVEDMVISDPFIRDGMKKMFVAKMLSPGEYTPAEAIRDTLREIGTRLTPQYNPSTDKLELVSNSVIKDAQSTVGATGIVLDMNDINRDIKDKFLAEGNPYNLSESMLEEIEKINVEGRLYVNARIVSGPALMYVPNEVYGGKQTYSVHIRTSAGKMEELLPAYRYDFQQTLGYESFQQAVDTLKSDRMKAFWGKFPFLDPNLVQPTFDALEKTRDDRSLNSLFSAYDKYIAGSRSNQLLSTDPLEPLNRDEIAEFYYMLERITTLGWR